jgi:hypothetical protein
MKERMNERMNEREKKKEGAIDKVQALLKGSYGCLQNKTVLG